jgi:predicted Zn-dependent peptidase
LKKQIKEYFGPIPRGTKDIPRPDMTEPYKMKEVRDTIWGDDQLPLVLMAYPIPAEGTPDYYAVDLLNTALSGGQSSRLNRAVVDEQELAVFCGAFSFGLEDPGQTIAYAVANIGTDPSEVETAMMTEINKVKAKGISEAELDKLKNQVESSFVQGNSTMRGIAESLANYHMYYGDANLINNEIDRYMEVTAEDIQAAAVKYYNHDRRVVLYFMNENAQ